MGGELTWKPTLKRPLIITSVKWDSISWMTNDFKVEIQAWSMDNALECKLFCCNFGGQWSIQNRKLNCNLEEHVDFQTLSMKG